MHTTPLQRARVSSSQLSRLSHSLAALNHWQWMVMSTYVHPQRESFANRTVEGIVSDALEAGLKKGLVSFAKSVIGMVERECGPFAFPPDVNVVTNRKLAQFTGWVEYAKTKPEDSFERNLLQCRTQFLELPPDMQASDYAEAAADLRVIAKAGGLVLPDVWPDFVPQSPGQLKSLRFRHSLGVHGIYSFSPYNWVKACAGCGRSWSMVP